MVLGGPTYRFADRSKDIGYDNILPLTGVVLCLGWALLTGLKAGMNLNFFTEHYVFALALVINWMPSEPSRVCSNESWCSTCRVSHCFAQQCTSLPLR